MKQISYVTLVEIGEKIDSLNDELREKYLNTFLDKDKEDQIENEFKHEVKMILKQYKAHDINYTIEKTKENGVLEFNLVIASSSVL